MKKNLLLLIAILFSIPSFSQKPYVKKGEPASHKKWGLSFSDEFRNHSTIDLNWMPQNASPEHIESSRWRENLTIRFGKLRISNKNECKGGKQWTSGCITCRTNNGYGYYECRAKISKARGVNNSFWMSAARKPGLSAFEIDFFEIHYPNVIHYTVIDLGAEKTTNKISYTEIYRPDYDLSNAYHIYGVDWNENTIDFYFDGELIWSVKNTVCNHIGPISLATAVLSWAGEINDTINDTRMMVDYVRYWKIY